MNLRFLGIGSIVLASCSALGGCDWPNRNLRHREPTASRASLAPEEGESAKVLDVQADSASSKPKPFFRSSRLPSGLSDEAREIERDMGIH